MRSSLLLLVLPLCASFVGATSIPPQAEQERLSWPNVQDETGEEQGQLRRFHCASSQQCSEILGLLEDEPPLDVWQVTPSYIDIYFPLSSGSASALLNRAHTSIPLASSHIDTPPYPPLPDLSDITSLNTTYHAAYHPLPAIRDFLKSLADQHPDKITLIPLGHSGEGREMVGVKISSPDPCTRKVRGSASKKSGFMINGAQHSREWVATSASLYLIHALVSNSSEKGSLSHLLNTYDFYIIPLPNPDGYEYTWSTDRLWYKNRMALGPDDRCVGLDMGRNWGHKWGKNKYKKQPCHHWFPGHRPFEAPEVNNVANFITTIPRLRAFVDLRAYGQMISIPYSYSCKKVPKDAEDLLEAALGAAQAARRSHGTTFKTGSLCDTLYRAPGNVIDWMYKKAGVKYSYAVHLRDTGTYGFSLPEEWLRPVGEETADMIEYLANFILTKRVHHMAHRKY
ncbi:hypothetical protein GLOTRDRAFT_108207 [Gloeophyllum trabeum ATCC 11539]|uniref:Inactive metallocarboxypeptidase ECM14 n=1 Tax=Gloeophyllum trabeum (strain ATCC 11539 / FP-39264 / Madison 617) TaxID=670483 RepID=S7RFF9_GLOTA|nr:uncharacterized protein GLOTRDRAFT_108207 [Gloeophyllum trabeum ATCC 11539]EPQ51249.1 hypothetical protein GLOTRDRAFT_108207 [Gloeophyllum trabeum ATCC 11539]